MKQSAENVPGARAFAVMALLVLACGADRARSAEAQWSDIEGQIEYGFFTEDAHLLVDLAATLEQSRAAAPADALAAYYAGFANYRLALISRARNKDLTKLALERCAGAAGKAFANDAQASEAIALQAACLAQLSSLNHWTSPLAGSKSRSLLEHALHLAPRNPRVQLIDALSDQEAEHDPVARERVLSELRAVAVLFEAERQRVTPTPGWGAAEVYFYLARSCLDQGDGAAARAALERSLLIAPEFTLARRLMQQLTRG